MLEILRPLAGHRLLRGRPIHRDVLEWLGVAAWLSGAEDEARLVFAKLILEFPAYRLDELVYPLDLVRFYDARRQEMIDLGVVDPTRDPSVKSRLVLVRRERTRDLPTLAYFSPFGVGQFANDDDGKGAVALVLQVVGLATTAGAWLAVDGLKDAQGYVPRADANSATALNALWIAGAALFAGAYIFSVSDGLLNADAAPEVELRYEFMDIEDLPAPPDSARLELRPGPGEVGLGLGLSF